MSHGGLLDDICYIIQLWGKYLKPTWACNHQSAAIIMHIHSVKRFGKYLKNYVRTVNVIKLTKQSTSIQVNSFYNGVTLLIRW